MFCENEESGMLYSYLKVFTENFYKIVLDSYKAYNLLEKLVLFDERYYNEVLKYISKNLIDEFQKKIRILSMQIQRFNPTDWNYFFDLSINYVDE